LTLFDAIAISYIIIVSLFLPLWCI